MTIAIERLAAAALFTLTGCMREPDPADAIAGRWEPVRAGPQHAPPVLSYDIRGDRLTMQSSEGRRFDLGIAGDEAPLAGAPAGTSVAVQRVPSASYREVVRRNGKVVAVRIVTIVDRRLATVVDNPLDGSATVYAAVKR